MSNSITDILGAEDEIYGVVHSVVRDSVPDLFPQAPKVYYQGVSVADDEGSPPVDESWLRVSYTVDRAGQNTLSEEGRAKRWGRRGHLFVQFFNPIKNPTALKTNKALAILVQRAYESSGGQCGMIYREARIYPVGPADGWYQLNLSVEYEYEEFH